MAEWETLRDDSRILILAQAVADRIAAPMHALMAAQAHPFRHPFGARDTRTQAQYGGKCIIKNNPSAAEVNSGIKQQVTLVDWQSPDGQAHQVTVEVGRIAAGGGGSFPAATDASNNKLSYRASAQVIYGTPATMQEPFLIDVNRGQRFTVTASYVAITVQMDPPPAVPGYVSGSLAVFANLGGGVTPSLAPVLFTQYIDVPVPGALLIGPVQKALLVIPEKANQLLPVRSGEQVNIQIDFFDAAGTRVDSLPTFPSGAMVTPVALAEDIYQLVLTGTSTASNFRLVYQLSI